MASAQMTCPNCQTVLAVETEWAGMQITCPQCNATVTVPAFQQQAAPQPGFQQGYQQPGFQQGYQQPGFQQGYAEDVNMITALKKFAQFTGRSRRKEYWLFYLFNFLVSFGLGFIEGLLGIPGILSLIFTLALIVPNIAVGVRRLHDIGKSGWNLFFVLIPIVGPIILLVFFCMDSQPGANEYGPNPKGY